MKILVDRYAVFASNYIFHPKYKLGVWDGKLKFVKDEGMTYAYLLPEILQQLVAWKYKIQLDDERDNVKPLRFITKDEFKHVIYSKTGLPFELRPYQVEACNALLEDGNGLIVAATSAGKAQPLYSPVLTPSGWATMGDMSIGSMVNCPDGTVASVVGVFPQGMRPTYRLSFSDGTTVDADAEHIWDVQVPSSWDVRRVSRTMTTLEIVDWLNDTTSGKVGSIAISAIQPQQFTGNEVSLPGYVVGALIGDGSLKPGSVSISSADNEIIDRLIGLLVPFGVDVKHRAKYDYGITKVGYHRAGPNRVLNALREYNLAGCTSAFKFIPPEYMVASLDVRWELLRGLMDTDGTIGVNGDSSYSTVSNRLAQDVADLARSLGCIASIKQQKPGSYTHNGERRVGLPSYRVSIGCRTPKDLFHLTRKRDKCSEVRKNGADLVKRVVSVDYIGDAKTQCIMVDHPDHTYITDGYTKTHNTNICAGLCLPVIGVGGRVLIIVPSTSLVIQTMEALSELGFNVGEYSGTKKDYGNDVIVSTWQSLKNNPKLILTFQCLIVDEVHLAKGKVLNDLICNYAHKIPYRFGMTGTIPKEESDAMTIRVGLGDVKYVIPAHELQAQKYIAGLNVNVMMLMEDDDEDMFPDYASERNYLCRNPERLEWIADLIMMVNDGGPKSNTFILVSSIPMGNALQKLIPDSVFLNGKDDAIQRKRRYDQYEKENGLNTIATVQIAGTGLSVDRIYNLFYIDIGKSFVRVIQAIGRGLRKTHDKDHVEVFDITSSLKYSKRHLGQRKSFYDEAKYPFKLKKVKYRDSILINAKKDVDDTFTDVDILAVLGR